MDNTAATDRSFSPSVIDDLFSMRTSTTTDYYPRPSSKSDIDIDIDILFAFHKSK
jgi:hypothetical protein